MVGSDGESRGESSECLRFIAMEIRWRVPVFTFPPVEWRTCRVDCT
jgi:hypothetical protein